MKRLNLHFFKNLPDKERTITLSTMITFARMALVPFIVMAMVKHYWAAAFWLFVIAASSDVLDGALARLRNEQTFLGACLDPLADKLLTLSVFSALAFRQSPLFSIPYWFLAVVLIRELLLIASAISVYVVRGYLEVKPTRLGKTTTLVQVYFIIWLFACYFFEWVPIKTYYTMLGLMTVLVILSFIQYMTIGLRRYILG